MSNTQSSLVCWVPTFTVVAAMILSIYQSHRMTKRLENRLDQIEKKLCAAIKALRGMEYEWTHQKK